MMLHVIRSMTSRMVPIAILSTAIGWSRLDAQASQSVRGRVMIDRNHNGRVDAADSGVANVVVSNQLDVARSNSAGRFDLPSAGPTGIVNVSVPDGYRSVGAFYRALSSTPTDSLTFLIEKLPASGASVTFVHASDTHLADASLPRMKRFEQLVDSIKPSFVIITGDLVRDALRVGETEARSYYDLFQREAATFQSPLWTVPGNHEAFGIERDKSGVPTTHPSYGRTMYRSYRGPDYYSFNAAGVHFVGLNTIDIDDTRYYGHVDSLQLQWLKRDLDMVPPTMPVVTFNHIPFFSAMEAMHGLVEVPPAPSIISINGKNQFRHTVSNAADVIALLKSHPYPLALAGHIHTRERLFYEGTPTRFEQTAAIVGPTPTAGMLFTSGFSVYRITRGVIDAGTFVPLGLDKR